MKRIIILFALAANSIASLQTSNHSLIIAPRVGSTITRGQPIIIGIMNDAKKKPLKNNVVTIYANPHGVTHQLGSVVTNKLGVWSYRPNNNQTFVDGQHYIQASVQPPGSALLWAQGTLFTVQLSDKLSFYKFGNVSAANSSIDFPFDGSDINTPTPTIVGCLLDAHNHPVSGETVDLSVDGSSVGTATSDSNGVFSFGLSSVLVDGSHTVAAHCVQSAVDLTSISFTIDTVAPAAPVITAPSNGSTVTTNTFTVTGTSESYATITTYLDSDPYGEVCYADTIGAWSIDYTADNGAHTIAAQAADLAENEGPVSSTINFTVSF